MPLLEDDDCTVPDFKGTMSAEEALKVNNGMSIEKAPEVGDNMSAKEVPTTNVDMLKNIQRSPSVKKSKSLLSGHSSGLPIGNGSGGS